MHAPSDKYQPPSRYASLTAPASGVYRPLKGAGGSEQCLARSAMSIRDIYQTGFDEHRAATTQHTRECPECDGVVRTTTQETVCEDCGLIIDEQRVDHGPEWRPFETEERERTGAPLTERRHDRGLSTEIGWKRDGRGKTLSGQKRRQLSRLRREHSRAMWQSTAERNLAYGLGEVRRIAGGMGLTDASRAGVCAVPASPERGPPSGPVGRSDGCRRGLRDLSDERPATNLW